MTQGWSVRWARLEHKLCGSCTVSQFEAALIPLALGKPKFSFNSIDVAEQQNRFSRTTARQLPVSQGRSEQFKAHGAVWILYSLLLCVIECTLKWGPTNKCNPKEVLASTLDGKSWCQYNTRRGSESVEMPFCACPLYSAHFVKMREEPSPSGEKETAVSLAEFQSRLCLLLEKSCKKTSTYQTTHLAVQVLPLLKKPQDWLEGLQGNPNALMTAGKCSKWENPWYQLIIQIFPFPTYFSSHMYKKREFLWQELFFSVQSRKLYHQDVLQLKLVSAGD